MLSCLLSAFPLGSLFIRMPRDKPAMKHMFSIVMVLFYCFPMLEMPGAFYHFAASSMGTYMLCALVQGPKMPWIVFV